MTHEHESQRRTYSDSDLRAVYDVAAEFGPARAVPVRDRVFAQLPHLNEGQVAAVIAHVNAIESRAWDLAEAVWNDEMDVSGATSRLAGEFPELGGERASRAMGQAMHFVMK